MAKKQKSLPKPSPWAESFVGLMFDNEKALARQWHDQGSGNVLYGIPVGKNLWAKLSAPVHQCCHTVFIFLLVVLDDNGRIRWAGEQVQQVFNDGHGEVLEVPLFLQDGEAAAEELRKVTSAAQAVGDTVAAAKRPIRKRK